MDNVNVGSEDVGGDDLFWDNEGWERILHNSYAYNFMHDVAKPIVGDDNNALRRLLDAIVRGQLTATGWGEIRTIKQDGCVLYRFGDGSSVQVFDDDNTLNYDL